MTTTSRVRWQCPNGCSAVLGPQRPRKDNAVRYCMACTAKTGKLVERTAPSLEAKRQSTAQSAAKKARAKVARAKAAEDAKWTVDGVDLRKALKLAMKLPSASVKRSTPTLVVRQSRAKNYTTGHAFSNNRITLTVGVGNTAGQAVGVLLHELAHLACLAAREPWGDADRTFANRCHDLHDEWNKKHSKIAKVDDRASGAYRGSIGRARRDARLEVAAPIPPASRPAVTVDDCNYMSADIWDKIKELHADGGEVAIPGALASEINYRYVEPCDRDTTTEDRLRFIEIFEAAPKRRMGKGWQYALTFGPGEIELLSGAIDWTIDGWAEEAAAEAAAIRVVSKLVNRKSA